MSFQSNSNTEYSPIANRSSTVTYFPHRLSVKPEGVQARDPMVTVLVQLLRVDRLVVVNQQTRNFPSRFVSKSLEAEISGVLSSSPSKSEVLETKIFFWEKLEKFNVRSLEINLIHNQSHMTQVSYTPERFNSNIKRDQVHISEPLLPPSTCNWGNVC